MFEPFLRCPVTSAVKAAAVILLNEVMCLNHAVGRRRGAPAKGVGAAGAGPVIVNVAASGCDERTFLVGTGAHVEHGNGETRVGKRTNRGVHIQELLAGHLQPADKTQDIIGRQRQGEGPAAASKAGHVGITVEAEGLSLLEHGQGVDIFLCPFLIHQFIGFGFFSVHLQSFSPQKRPADTTLRASFSVSTFSGT